MARARKIPREKPKPSTIKTVSRYAAIPAREQIFIGTLLGLTARKLYVRGEPAVNTVPEAFPA
jgi:hypothetical protein